VHRAGYHLFRVEEAKAGFSISAELRGLGPLEGFTSLGAFDITKAARRSRAHGSHASGAPHAEAAAS